MKIINHTLNKAVIRTRAGARMRSGVSLLISIVLISIVMVFALGVSNLVVSSLRQTANVNRSNQAFFAAEGALEQGLLLNQTMGAGFTTDPSEVNLNCGTSGENCPTATVQIQGTVNADMKYAYTGTYNAMYGMPTPGTGNVGSNCSILNAYYNKAFVFPEPPATNGQSYPPWEHPCNWNKLKVGESVSIPLYTMPGSTIGVNCDWDEYLGDRVCNPAKLGLTELVVRVRTPCIDGSEFCTALERYNLDNYYGDPLFNGDDTILAWQITATSLDHKEAYILKPRADVNIATPLTRKPINSEIYESLINFARSNTSEPFKVLKETNAGQDLMKVTSSIKGFLTNISPFARTGEKIINQPVLKLTLVHSLDSYTDSTSVPYLEYQVLTNNSLMVPADTAQTIRSEGLSGTFMQVLEVKQPQESGLLEYVIQQ